MEWVAAGELNLADDGRLVFPQACKIHAPGVYRYKASDGSAYVGQAATSLRRRFRQYRRGSGLPCEDDRLTTRRNSHHFRDVLASGGTVTVEVITGPELTSKTAIDALERAEIAALRVAGFRVLNRAHTGPR